MIKKIGNLIEVTYFVLNTTQISFFCKLTYRYQLKDFRIHQDDMDQQYSKVKYCTVHSEADTVIDSVYPCI